MDEITWMNYDARMMQSPDLHVLEWTSSSSTSRILTSQKPHPFLHQSQDAHIAFIMTIFVLVFLIFYYDNKCQLTRL